MRYRIQITTFKNGRQEFRAQKKVLFGWTDLDYDGEVTLACPMPVSLRSQALSKIDKHYAGNTKKQTIEFEYITKP